METNNQESAKKFSPEEIRGNKFIVVYDDTNKNHALHIANACSDKATATCWSEKTYLANEEQMTNQNIVIFLSEKLIAENISSPTLKKEEESNECLFVRDGKKYGIIPRPINDEELNTYWNRISKSAKDSANYVAEKLKGLWGTDKEKDIKITDETNVSIGTFPEWIAPTVIMGTVSFIGASLITTTGVIPAALLDYHDKKVQRAALKSKFLWDGVEYFINNRLNNILAK